MEMSKRCGRGFGKKLLICPNDGPRFKLSDKAFVCVDKSMKSLLVLIFTFSCALNAFGQREGVEGNPQHLEIRIKKQIICDDLERQLKNIPFAAVRVLTRYKVASWLWKDGDDDTDRAEDIAVRAIDDLYTNKAEIPDYYLQVLRAELFAMLDKHAWETSDKLREKHKISSEDELGILDSLLHQKGGEKLAADAAIKSLVNQSQENPDMSVLIWRLQQRKSPELLRLLVAIIDAEEKGRTKFTAATLFSMAHYFVEASVPKPVQKRFLEIVVTKSRNVGQMPGGDTEGFFDLLSSLISSISTIHPQLLREATVVQLVLKTRISQESKEIQERNDRIRDSADKLAALIAEAEQTNDKATKYGLYVRAAKLALAEKKFTYSVDIVEKTVEIDSFSDIISEPFRKQWLDQFLGQVVAAALQSNDSQSAKYATKQMVDPLSKADSLRRIANYYFDHSDPGPTYDALDESIKLISRVEGGDRRIFSLINMLPTVQRIDRNRFSELSELAAKSINSIPSLDVEDKPQTNNFKNYVTSVMNINWNLIPALTKLLKENKSDAANLAGRINKKEIRIIADFLLLTDLMISKANLETANSFPD